MRNLQECSNTIDRMLMDRGIRKYSYSITESGNQEFNMENGDFSLLRTTMGNGFSMTVFLDAKKGSASGNDISDAGIEKVIGDAVLAAESAVPDPMHDIAPFEEEESFALGVQEPDEEAFFSRVQELNADIARHYPLIRVMMLIAAVKTGHTLYRNSNGTKFEFTGGAYGVSLEFSAGEGEKTTGLDYTGFITDHLDKRFIDCGSIRQHLDDTSSRLLEVPLGEKFTGTVIMMPECLANFMGMILGNYVSGSVILDGTSQWLNRIGTQVADPSLTLSICPWDKRIVMGERWTSDGFRTEDVTIIDKGVLKNHLIGLYVANKTGRPVTKNTDGSLIVEPGTKTLKEMISSVDRGILMGGFSGGEPGSNGDFSGVAKNSFLIENGMICGAINETMVSGNLGDMLMHIEGISKETVEDGSMAVPYMAVSGIVISGK